MAQLNDLKETLKKENASPHTLPLAIATVPFQTWNSTYEFEAALKIGTIFPELNLPFYAGGDIQ